MPPDPHTDRDWYRDHDNTTGRLERAARIAWFLTGLAGTFITCGLVMKLWLAWVAK